jgi:hypothetical protein
MDRIAAYQRFVHVDFKLNILAADICKKGHNNLIVGNGILHSIDKLVANFVGLD